MAGRDQGQHLWAAEPQGQLRDQPYLPPQGWTTGRELWAWGRVGRVPRCGFSTPITLYNMEAIRKRNKRKNLSRTFHLKPSRTEAGQFKH